MAELFGGEEWLMMSDAAREIEVGYNVITNFVHYHRGLESRKFGALRFVKRTELLAKADEIREYAANRTRRGRNKVASA